MRTLNLSGFKPADSLSISVSQGAITAGPYNVPAWGGGGGGGTIAVNAVHRSLRQIAPDSVRFEVDLSASNFDTPGPVGDEVYDARLHDLIYLWDMGDPGTWSEPVNVLPVWKNRNLAKGPSVRQVYREPGDYTVSVLVIEPSTGKTATASTTVAVSDPQDFYGDANTIYVNNVGDNDFSYVPAGVPLANRVNTDKLLKYHNGSAFVSDATWAAFAGGHAKRWRFKRGGSWEMNGYLSSTDTPDTMFDDYGDQEDPNPIWNVPEDPESYELALLQMGYAHDQHTASGRTPYNYAPEVRIRNIRGQGRFDPTTNWIEDPTAEKGIFFICNCAFNVVIVDCQMDKFGNSTINAQAGSGDNYDRDGRIHIDNCAITNFGGQYPVIVSNSEEARSSAVFTGVRWEQAGDALAPSPTKMASRSPARIGTPRFIHIRGCDIFHTDADLTSFQILKFARNDGYLVNIHSCSSEGGSAFMDTDGSFQSTPQNRSHVHNIIVDGVVYVGWITTNNCFDLRTTGATIRNILFIQPQSPKLGNSLTSFIRVREENNTGNPLPDFVANAPIRVYNCTFRVDRTALQNSPSGTWVPDFVDPAYSHPSFTVSEENNVFHMPNLSVEGNPNAPNTTFAPLSENILWTPRCLGRRDPDTLVLDTQYATPVGAVMDTKPLPGSAALGAALNGNVSYMDILGTTRTAPADKGAWEAA